MYKTQSKMETDNKDMSNKNVELKPFIGRGDGFIFVHKKTEKLASAIYMVTSLLSDNEPMKWSLRKKSSDLASLIILYKDIPESGLYSFINDVRTKVLELVSMLEISSMGGLISPMNFSVLKHELSNLITMFNMSHGDLKVGSSESLPKHFFDISEKERNGPMLANYVSQTFNRTEGFSRDIKDIQPKSDDVYKKSNRQNIIIGLLKKKSDLTIKDISQVIRDCSEKTIQRELLSLVTAGVVVKAGERRWSKYSLSSVQ